MSFETLDTTPSRDFDREAGLVERGPPVLIVALACLRPTALGCRVTLEGVDEVIVARSTGSRIERAGRATTIFIGDSQASRQHLRVRRTPSGWWIEDLGSKNGTIVNGEPVTGALLSDGDVIEAGGTFLLFIDDGCPPCRAHDGEPPASGAPGVPGGLGAPGVPGVPGGPGVPGAPGVPGVLPTLSVMLERRLRQVRKIAASSVPVLVRGETGTGKELVARAIHDASERRGPFVPVNCGALPRDLIESELFGHRRGAFSGASGDRDGLVRRAHRGTLFLDEIAELPPDSQVALLRVLQEGEVRPVGATEAIHVDVRIVAATHQDLRERIATGRFREDLYARIAGFEVTMPALRHRREDLGMLIATILARTCAEPERVTLTKAAVRVLFQYAWPLNVRELEQTLRAAIGLSDGGEIGLEHLPVALTDAVRRTPGDAALLRRDRERRERLIELLRETDGNVAAVARAMATSPVQIRRWCSRLQIDVNTFRSGARASESP